MARQFLLIMAELDGESQKTMEGWYQELRKKGFVGQQTPNLPFHFSMANLPVDQEEQAKELVKRIASEFAPIPFHIGHMGVFSGGKVLFGAPDLTRGIQTLFEATTNGKAAGLPWVPHATILLDEPEVIVSAMSEMIPMFHPFRGRITRLRLCEFWPTREILSLDLTGDKVVDELGCVPGYQHE